MKKIIITLITICLLSLVIGVTLNISPQKQVSVLNAAINNVVLYADGLPGDTDTLSGPRIPPVPPIK